MIIGLNGHLGTGKDTVADCLVEHYGFKKIGFSDMLYAGVEGLLDIDHDAALQYKNDSQITIEMFDGSTGMLQYTFREFLQRFGTEMGRDVWGEDFWIELFEHEYDLPAAQHGDIDYVVRDVRFNNEAFLLAQYGGFVWQIHRPEHDGDSHESESGINEEHIVGDIVNDGSLDELYETVNEWMEECYGRRQLSDSNQAN